MAGNWWMRLLEDTKALESIPNAKVGQIVRLVEKLGILGGGCDRAGLAYALGVTEGTVYGPVQAAHAIGLVAVQDQHTYLTETGESFLESDEIGRKRIFGEQLEKLEPFATVVRALAQNPLTEEELMNYIRARMSSARSWKESTAKEMFRTIRSWCIYGDILAQDPESGMYMRL